MVIASLLKKCLTLDPPKFIIYLGKYYWGSGWDALTNNDLSHHTTTGDVLFYFIDGSIKTCTLILTRHQFNILLEDLHSKPIRHVILSYSNIY
jgi:hypothetical protein